MTGKEHGVGRGEVSWGAGNVMFLDPITGYLADQGPEVDICSLCKIQ